MLFLLWPESHSTMVLARNRGKLQDRSDKELFQIDTTGDEFGKHTFLLANPLDLLILSGRTQTAAEGEETTPLHASSVTTLRRACDPLQTIILKTRTHWEGEDYLRRKN